MTDEWNSGTPMLTSRYAVDIAVIDDFLYAIGGGSGLSPIYANELYVPMGHELSDDSSLFDIPPPPPPTPLPTEDSTPTVPPEPFPTTLVLASAAILSIVGLGILAYTKKRRS